MKALPLLRMPASAALALLLLLSGCGICAARETMQPEKDAPMEQCNFKQEGARNSVLKIELARPGATGFQWFAEVPKDSNIRLLEEGQLASKNPAAATGEPVRQWWTFQLGEGKTATVDFFLYRVWEGKDRAVKHCVAQVTIK